MIFLWIVMITSASIFKLITCELIKSSPGPMHCGAVPCDHVCTFISAHSFEIPLKTTCTSIWTHALLPKIWLVLCVTPWVQMKNRPISNNKITHICVQFSIIHDTLTVSSITSRSRSTADLFSTAHYKESLIKQEACLTQINQETSKEAVHILWFIWVIQNV